MAKISRCMNTSFKFITHLKILLTQRSVKLCSFCFSLRSSSFVPNFGKTHCKSAFKKRSYHFTARDYHNEEGSSTETGDKGTDSRIRRPSEQLVLM
ncbi:hypothetical protein Mapa_002582 [Marchantia paleacea]|nr:hypothetical protein Mapa_002582 [Marchantia paleacea]